MAARFGPRDVRAASRLASLLALAGAVVTLTLTLADGSRPVAGEVLVPAGLALVALATWTARARWTGLLCLLTPLAGVVGIVVLDLSTDDASAAAQVFFCVPVLYGAAQLRTAGAVVVLVAALAGEGVVALSLQPLGPGLMDVGYVGTTLVLLAVLLSHTTSENSRLVERLRRQASMDPLTGLVTRTVLDEAAANAMAGPPEPGTALAVIDLDLFKTINDVHGHPVGDDALRHVADIVLGLTRGGDVVARLGADEIGVLLPGCGYEAARVRCEGIVAAVRGTPLTLDGGERLDLSISAGVAHSSSAPGGLRELYAAADAALYRAKRAGRGRVGEVELRA